MKPEEAIFEQALTLTSSEARAGYLLGACGKDSDLRRRVEALLAAHGEAAALGFLRAEGRSAEAATLPLPVTEKAGDRIGRYKLLQQIGEGGCGMVYMAEQEEPVRRRVALKVIKLGMDTKSVIARFEAERQALALMDHPNIAKVLDAGATDTGRPYFVMELVRGIRITDYCDQHSLSTRERLDLFIQVCHAVQHAHQKGIIHRDIKPSNILVSLHDSVPVPVVIDFGIAKATEQRLTDKTLYTAFEQFIGTPAYTSPEQAELSRLDIDTRSDIYSLGVLLYELLTGKTPFDSQKLLAAGLDEMRRTIREQEPARPSTRLNTLQGEELTTTAKRRGTEAPKLIHLVRGDLDWIAMKCLEKERTRRYETANGLAQDLERHLNHEPVEACPPSTAYRVQKFVRRNKVMVTAGAVLTAVLVLDTAVSTWQAVRASRQRERAEANEHKARAARENEAKQRRLAQAQAYAADVKIADTALRENNLGQAMAALRRQIPETGEADLRGIEWRYLWHKCQGQQSKVFRHEAEVTCAEWSPDGRWLASESGGAFWVWDTTREGERRLLSSGAARDGVRHALGEHLAFDPQGRFLATATSSGVLIWNMSDWRKRQSLPATNANVCFSGDGTTLATFGDEGIQVWKAATWERVARPGEFALVYYDFPRIALNRDGSLLAASCPQIHRNESSADEEVALWNVPRRQLLFKLSGIKIQKLALSDDDRWLAACTLGPPATVWLWSVPEGKLVARWPVSEGLGRALAFAPGGQLLATAGSDQVISLWDTAHTNRQGLLQGHLGDVCSLRFTSDGPLVSASNDKTVRLWNLRPGTSGPPAFSLPQGRLIGAQSADVRRMVTVNLTNLTFEEWDTTRDSAQPLRATSIQGADDLLHHGTLSNGQPLQAGLLRDWFVFDWEVKPGDSRVRILGFAQGSGSPSWDLCASTGDGRVYAWNADSGELVHSNKVAASLLAVIPLAGHKQLVLLDVATGVEGTLSRYDVPTEQTEPIDDHVTTGPLAFAVSPDARFFAYLTTGGQVKVWDATFLQTKTIVQPPKPHPITNATTVAFSPDSRYLAVATEEGWLQVRDVAGQLVSDLAGAYLSGTIKVGFSADSKALVTYGVDGTARIWNLATSREMISGLPVNGFLTYHLRWDLLPPEGNSVLESAGEAAIRVLHLPTLAEIDALETLQTKQP